MIWIWICFRAKSKTNTQVRFQAISKEIQTTIPKGKIIETSLKPNQASNHSLWWRSSTSRCTMSSTKTPKWGWTGISSEGVAQTICCLMIRPLIYSIKRMASRRSRWALISKTSWRMICPAMLIHRCTRGLTRILQLVWIVKLTSLRIEEIQHRSSQFNS